jgi:hypothetical protein
VDGKAEWAKVGNTVGTPTCHTMGKSVGIPVGSNVGEVVGPPMTTDPFPSSLSSPGKHVGIWGWSVTSSVLSRALGT